MAVHSYATLFAFVCISGCLLRLYKSQLIVNETRAARHGVRLHDSILEKLPYHTDQGEISCVMLLMYSTAVYQAFLMYDIYTVCVRLICYCFDLSIVYAIKCITLYCCPLLPPEDNHHLVDPMLKSLNMLHRNDLLFSGHAASTFLLILHCPGDDILTYVLCSVWCVLIYLLLITRCHYTIDVVVAPFVTYAVYSFNTQHTLYTYT